MSRLFCAFCGLPQEKVFNLISCPEDHLVKVCICDACVDVCVMILYEEYAKDKASHDQYYDELASSLFPK